MKSKKFTIFDQLKLFFDMIRIVDPVSKKVINTTEETGLINNYNCYDMWECKDICDNCISMRAYNDNKSCIKIENHENKIYCIIASPIVIDEKRYIVEAFKDISDSEIMYGLKSNSVEEIKNEIEKLNKIAVTDELTKCFNRRYINERLPVDIADSILNEECLSIAVVDIDNFKSVNDNYSHQVGDLILQEVSQIINLSIRRDYDWAARYGGEEFIIVFKNSNKYEAVKSADRIRQMIEMHKFKYKDIEIKLTASFGISQIDDGIVNMESIIADADKKMYQAKKLGKNLVIV